MISLVANRTTQSSALTSCRKKINRAVARLTGERALSFVPWEGANAPPFIAI